MARKTVPSDQDVFIRIDLQHAKKVSHAKIGLLQIALKYFAIKLSKTSLFYYLIGGIIYLPCCAPARFGFKMLSET